MHTVCAVTHWSVHDPAARVTQIEIAGLLALVLEGWGSIDFWIIFALLMTNATLGFVEEMNAQVISRRPRHNLHTSTARAPSWPSECCRAGVDLRSWAARPSCGSQAWS